MTDVGFKNHRLIAQSFAESILVGHIHQATGKHHPAEEEACSLLKPAGLFHMPQGVVDLLGAEGKDIKIPKDFTIEKKITNNLYILKKENK